MFDKLIKAARLKAALQRVASYLKKKFKPKKHTTEDQNKSVPVHVVQESIQELVSETIPQAIPQAIPKVLREPNILDTPYINFQLWTRISSNLPPDYMLPNPESVDILFPKSSDYYRSLFTIPSNHQHVMVDDQVWRRIKEALPNGYQIPDSRLTSDLK
ncbi:hypothetical protein [Cohnella mopanensis]|uniref:hypothetical protein n=1 Tax=Cohnella mopanensis TaxID=2911966 RepID=UPI001EF98D60|nr:hypothetical protein [Cohnella mopanensis]